MRVGKLGLFVLLAAASAVCGCVTVEPTRNESTGSTNAANGNAVAVSENHALQASPTPSTSPKSVNANSAAASEESGGKLDDYARAAAADIAAGEREALGRIPEESRR